ncbi:uncharacterized protein LOC142169780 [Nicotiana tabacum]|uniref:Uncharacterized protein LOC142169780 n=1 Tax=Nicotiana tabacum TaxID=4097 RepID=A0AC58SS44_TOBAC
MDEPGSPVNETMYRGIIGSLLVGLCCGFQSSPNESRLKAAKRILRYADADHVGYLVDQKENIWNGTFSGVMLYLIGYKETKLCGSSTIEAEYVNVATCCAQLL